MIAEACHEEYVDTILQTIEEAAKVRGTGIAKRTHEYVAQKMKEGKAVIALSGTTFAGFSYIESWGNKQYVTTSGLIVHPDFRGLGVAKRIKDMTFQFSTSSTIPGSKASSASATIFSASLLSRTRRICWISVRPCRYSTFIATAGWPMLTPSSH